MSTERALLELAVMFVAAKAAGALFERLRQPAVIGELGAGIVLGPHLLAVVGHSQVHEVFQELGAIVLLFAVGLDTPWSSLRAVGGRAAAVGTLGIVVPFAAGTGLLLIRGNETPEALFMGTAMVATSVGVTARVLSDLGRIRADESRIILGAAVVDDVLGLLILAVVAGIAAGSIAVGEVLSLVLLAVGFVAIVGGIGPRLVGRAEPLLTKLGDAKVFTLALGICLGLSAAAGALQLAAIVGAFLAGMAFAETREHYRLEERLSPIYRFLVPFFFVVTGTLVDLSVLGDPGVAAFAAAIIAIAITGKLVGCGVAALGMGTRSAAIVGVGMVPRGEVGILVASIGLARGIIGPDLYGVVVVMSIVTTVIVPPALAVLFRASERQEPTSAHTDEIEGIGG